MINVCSGFALIQNQILVFENMLPYVSGAAARKNLLEGASEARVSDPSSEKDPSRRIRRWGGEKVMPRPGRKVVEPNLFTFHRSQPRSSNGSIKVEISLPSCIAKQFLWCRLRHKRDLLRSEAAPGDI